MQIKLPSQLYREWQLILTAIMFYTRIPVPKSLEYTEKRLNRSRTYFPAIGLLIGGLSALLFLVLSKLLPLSVSVALTICAGIVATGAFHEDGFADSCDGLGGGWSKSQVLTIMKDSRLGTYGCVGLLLLLSIKFLVLWEITQIDTTLFCAIIIFAHTLSRLFSSSVIEFYQYVQDIDKSKVKPITNHKLGIKSWIISIGSAAIPTFTLIYQDSVSLINVLSILIVAAFICWQFSEYTKRRIGGYTGDTLGATQQLSEVLIYLTLLIIIN